MHVKTLCPLSSEYTFNILYNTMQYNKKKHLPKIVLFLSCFIFKIKMLMSVLLFVFFFSLGFLQDVFH